MRSTTVLCSPLASTKSFLQTTFNPSNVNFQRSLAKLKFEPQALLLFTTPQHSKQIISKVLDLRDHQKDLQIVYASVDSIAPYSSKNGLSELWLSKRMSIRHSKTIEQFKLEQQQQAASGDVHKPGRIVSAGINNWDRVSNWFQVSIPAISNHLTLHYSSSLPAVTTDVRFKLAPTLFHNEMPVTSFYFLSEVEKNGLLKLDQDKFPDIKTYLANDGHYLHEATVVLPPMTVPTRSPRFSNYSRLVPITAAHNNNDDAVLKVTQVTGNLIKAINGKPASSIIQENEQLMAIMNKDTKIYATIQNEPDSQIALKFDIKRFEVIAGGGAWGAKANTLALDPAALEFLKEGTIIKFLFCQPIDSNDSNSIDAEKKDFFGKANIKHGIFAEMSIVGDSFGDSNNSTDNGAEVKVEEEIHENWFGFGSELKLKVNDVNFDSEAEVVVLPDITSNNIANDDFKLTKKKSAKV